jgi:glycosyltransferase involved in cell wall biosynthesis
MKIIILSTAFPYRGGISNFTSLLFKELIKKNDVEVITFKRQYPSFLFPGKSQIEEGETPARIPAERLVDSINPINWIKIGLNIKHQKPDLMIIAYFMPFFAPCFGTIYRITKRNKKTKVLAVCHNIIPHEKKTGDKILSKFFFKSVDYFIVLSEKVRQELLNLKPDAKYKFLPHPIYSFFGEGVSKKVAREYLKINVEKILLFFGFIREYKGLDVLLQAIALLKNKINMKLIIAGEFYGNEEFYKKLIGTLGIQEKLLLFNDFVPTTEVKYFFSASDAVILPYKHASQSGIVQIAMNFKKPVIAANVGGLAEVVKNEKTGYIVEKENPAALADTILKFYSENKEDEFVRNIEEEVKKYSWEKFVDGMLELVK